MKTPEGLHGLSPTAALLFGLLVTLVTVMAYSWYVIRQVSSLERLQADLIDRNRMASLQLLRIQADLNRLGLAMRDMLESSDSLSTWQDQFHRIRTDLDDALRREVQVSVAARTDEQNAALNQAVSSVWDTSSQVFALSRAGREEAARDEIRGPLQARVTELEAAVGRLLLENNETEARAADQAQEIYRRVRRQVYAFLSAALFAIAATSLYLIHSNDRLFARLGALARERRELARTLISTREATLREIARELHDEFGQLLTAMGAMLRRLEQRVPDGSDLGADLREVGDIAQAALENVRGLSQTLHPSVLDELGLDSAIEWYLSTTGRQLGIPCAYARSGTPPPIDPGVGIHVYRVLQESMNNLARHSGATSARVALTFEPGMLQLDVADDGRGMAVEGRQGLGLVAMRERAELVGGTIQFLEPASGGTLVRLRVPLAPAGAAAAGAPA